MENLELFNGSQLLIVNHTVAMAEDLVLNAYKFSASQWAQIRYDVKTLMDLQPDEVVNGPFAQVVRYVGRRNDSMLESRNFDFYKICLQDHTILPALHQAYDLALAPFVLYVIIHELIHIVRFIKFLQNFDASPFEKMAEEARVHQQTREILKAVSLAGIEPVISFFAKGDTFTESIFTK